MAAGIEPLQSCHDLTPLRRAEGLVRVVRRCAYVVRETKKFSIHCQGYPDLIIIAGSPRQCDDVVCFCGMAG